MRPGEEIAGRYSIVRSVRTGGVSVVYEAEDVQTGDRVALKIVSIPDTEEALVERIEREIKILTTLAHPHIVRCVGSGVLPDGRMYLVLDWLEGEDLADFKARAPMALRSVLEIILQVGSALDVAHAQGIIHRDIKPANIYLLKPEIGRRLSCRVLDFGVAKLPQANSALTRVGAILGTPSYMAPEQASYAMSVDGRADIFSLGVVAFEVLTGRLPWTAPSDLARLARILVEHAIPVLRVNPDVPSSVASLIDDMIRHEADDRIQTAYEVRRRAERCMSDLADGLLDTTFSVDEALLSEMVRAETLDLDPRGAEAAHPASVIVIPGADGRPPSMVSDERLAAYKSGSTEVLDMARVETPPPGTDDSIERPVVQLSDLEEDEEDLATEAVDPAAFERRSSRPSLDDQLSYVDQSDRTLIFGRVTEIKQLEGRALDPIRRSHAGSTILVGAAGSGKTRMRVEVARLVRKRQPSPRVFAGRAEESLRSTPFAFIRRVIFTAARVHATDAPEEQQRRLEQLLPEGDALIRLVEASSPPFGFAPEHSHSFFSGDVLQQHAGVVDVEEERAIIVGFACEALRIPVREIPPVSAAKSQPRLFGEQMRRALDVILRSLSRSPGFLIMVDDAHCLDHQSALVLKRILEAPRQLALSLVAFALPTLLDTETRAPSPLASFDATRIELAPLGARASREFARNLARGPVSSGALEQLVRRAAGNPLYLEQLVRAVQENGVLALSSDGELDLVGLKNDETDVDRIPPTVAAAVSMRLQNLDPRVTSLLGAASVFGEVFWVEGAAAMVGRNIEEVMIDFDRLLLENLVRRRATSRYRGETEMEFSHAAIRSVALSKLKRRRRHAYEKVAVEYLQACGETDKAVLALHLSQSGDFVEAASLYADAAEDSLRIGDPHSAGTLADEGMLLTEGQPDDGTRRRLIDLVERIAVVNQDWAVGLEALDALDPLCGTPQARAELAERRSRLSFLARDYPEAHRQAEQARVLSSKSGARTTSATAELRLAEASEALADGRTALRSYLVAHARFLDEDEPAGLARTTRGLASIALASGDYRTAENRFRESLKHAHMIHDHDAILQAHFGLAEVARLVGDLGRSQEHLTEVEREAFEPHRQMMVRIQAARLMVEEGNAGEALKRLSALETAGPPYMRRLVTLHRGQMLRDRRAADLFGDGRALQAALADALESATLEEPALVLSLKIALAGAKARCGAFDEAEALLQEATGQFSREGAIEGDEPPCIFLTQAQVLRAMGTDREKRRRAVRSAVLHLDSIASRLDRGLRQQYLSRWVGRAIVEEAEQLGLAVERDASSNRIGVR